MTYQMLKNVTTGLLIGDNVLPKDEDVMLSLVAMSLNTVATKADSLHLMTLSANANILRKAYGDYFIRVPETPQDEEDLVDIDDELGFAVARIIASYISKNKGPEHLAGAERLILDYNAKVYDITQQMASEADMAGFPTENNPRDPQENTVWGEGFSI